ncbi:MAG: hypothetical protein ACLT76_02880 [Clostridium fessum]
MRGLLHGSVEIDLVFRTIVLISGRGRYFHEELGRVLGLWERLIDPDRVCFFHLYDQSGAFYGIPAEGAEYTVKDTDCDAGECFQGEFF